MPETRRMRFCEMLAYSVGHFFNDLTASMWFSYLLIYYHKVVYFNNNLAGYLMLIGQVSDALSTPFVGIESDRTRGCFRLGKRKLWHFVGTVCVLCSFPFLFNLCITCSHSPLLAQFVYYAPFIVIFQFGWASVQVSHLALIPDLSSDPHDRVTMNSLRCGFTLLANLSVYGIAWLLFDISEHIEPNKNLGPEDASKFSKLAFIVCGTGFIFSLIFYLGTRERESEDGLSSVSYHNEVQNAENTQYSIESSALRKNTLCWKDWFAEPQFYQVGLLYMFTRLFVNISQVYLPMYLTDSINLAKDSIAFVPLIVYTTGFFASFFIKYLNNWFGRKLTYAFSLSFASVACVWAFFIPAHSKQVYGLASLIGIGGSSMLVTSLSMSADLISENTESGAFVYGALSFTDKLANGVAVVLIQNLHPCRCSGYYRNILSFVPGGAAVLAALLLLMLIPQRIGTRRKQGVKFLSPVSEVEGLTKGKYGSCSTREPFLQEKLKSEVKQTMDCVVKVKKIIENGQNLSNSSNSDLNVAQQDSEYIHPTSEKQETVDC